MEAGVEADRRRIEGEDDSARARQCTGDEECERDRPVDVDPHHCRSVFVLRRGTHRLALARVLDEPDQAEEDRDGDEQNEQPVPGVDDVADPEDLPTVPCRELVGRQIDRPRPFPDDCDVLENERHPDRSDQRCEARRSA